MPKPPTVFFKIISVGNQEAGKSCLIKRYCEGRFVKRYISTIGIDYGVKKLDLLDHKVCINFFDLSGNDEYKMIRTEFYKDASGIVMVFDVDNRDSYISLVHWEEEMKRYGLDMSRVKVVVCGNKCDSKGREVKEAEAQRWAKQRNWDYYETSASDGKNVQESFECCFTNCVK
jgi:DnaJ family protein C protein 27